MKSITISPMLDAFDRGERNFALLEVPVIFDTEQDSTDGIAATAKSGQFSQHPFDHFEIPYGVGKEQSID
jgi:hypothetical protein